MTRTLRTAAAALLVAALALSAASAAQYAAGVVCHDVNRDGIRTPGEPGIDGVRVSNGRSIVLTDAQGRYSLLWCSITPTSFRLKATAPGWT